MESGIRISVPYQIDVEKCDGFTCRFFFFIWYWFLFYQQIMVLKDGNRIYLIFYFFTHLQKNCSPLFSQQGPRCADYRRWNRFSDPMKIKNWCDVAERYSGSWLLRTFLKPSLKISSVFSEFGCCNRKLCVNKPISFFS